MPSGWGKFDFDEVKELAKNLKAAPQVIEKFMQDFLIEMAFRADAKIKQRTPVGVYSNQVNFTTKDGEEVSFTTKQTRTGGQLRRNWKVGSVAKQDGGYVVEIYNNTEYASYVEHGHRSGPNLTGWTPGRFMMTISMKEIETELPTYLQRRQDALLQALLGGKKPKAGPAGGASGGGEEGGGE